MVGRKEEPYQEKSGSGYGVIEGMRGRSVELIDAFVVYRMNSGMVMHAVNTRINENRERRGVGACVRALAGGVPLICGPKLLK